MTKIVVLLLLITAVATTMSELVAAQSATRTLPEDDYKNEHQIGGDSEVIVGAAGAALSVTPSSQPERKDHVISPGHTVAPTSTPSPTLPTTTSPTSPMATPATAPPTVAPLRELPVNSFPILIIIIDTDFTDLHRRHCPNY